MLEDAAHPPLPPTANCAVSAVLFAGGKSTRMGRDKAEVIFEGQPLWQRQLATLRSLHAPELFISGRADGPYAGIGVEIIPDITPGLGPLSGLEAALQHATCPLVLVLAVDLPRMHADFLSRLATFAAARALGVVPRAGEWFEPLAAVYPCAALPLVQQHLRGDDHSMQAFVRAAVAAHFIVPLELTAEDRALFRNANTPADLEN